MIRRRVRGTYSGGARPRDGREGVALLLALLLVALLSVIVMEFSYEMQVEASLVTNDEADRDAYVAAKSAVASAMALLAGDLLEDQLQYGAECDSYMDVWGMNVPLQPLNNAVMRCRISDEYGKLNLNAMIQIDNAGQVVENELFVETLRAFLDMRIEEYGLEENPTDAILDWLDPDSDARPDGAEMDFYSSLEIPYPCKNGPMDSIDELLMIRGVTPDLFFGVPPENPSPDDPMPVPLGEFLTVHGEPRGRINVNTTATQLLDALFEVWGQSGKTEMVVARREDQNPFTSMEELVSIFGQQRQGGARAKDVLTVSSRVFRVYGDGLSDEVKVRIEAYLWRNPGGAANTGGIVEAQEAFRVLDWRVIR